MPARVTIWATHVMGHVEAAHHARQRVFSVGGGCEDVRAGGSDRACPVGEVARAAAGEVLLPIQANGGRVE